MQAAIHLSIIYKYRQEHYVLTEVIPQLRQLLDDCGDSVIRRRISRKLQEWESELEFVEQNMWQRQTEFLSQNYVYIDPTYFGAMMRHEVDKENRHLALFKARKEQSLAYYRQLAGYQLLALD